MIKAVRCFSTNLKAICEAAKGPIILNTKCTDIKLNLATEEYLFDFCTITHPLLFLWRNDKTIVIGKHQNPWKECKIQEMKEDGINIARRKSGGGAVFHDLGNTCFTFINPFYGQRVDYKTYNTDVIINSLASLNIKAEPSGRNDILINGKKVSGSAYRLSTNPKRQISLHHGTMMRNVNVNHLQNYLTVNKAKLLSKGVDSVKSHVCNIKDLGIDLSHEEFCASMTQAFKNKYKGNEYSEHAMDEAMVGIDKIKEIYDTTSSWEWLFGKTPEFTHKVEKKLSWALIEFGFVVKDGMISELKVHSDCLYPDLIDNIHKVFSISRSNNISFEYSEKGIGELMGSMKKVYCNEEPYSQYIKDLEGWLAKAI